MRTPAPRRRIAVAMFSLAIFAAPAAATPVFAQRTPDQPGSVRRLQESSHGTLRMSRHSVTGRVRFLGSTKGRPIEKLRSSRGRRADAVAGDFLRRHAALFGAEPRDLRTVRSEAGRGTSAVRLQQLVAGVPVIGGEFVVSLDADNAVLSVSGEASAARAPVTTPAVSSAAAAGIAAAIVARDRGVAASALHTSVPQLAFYDPALIGVAGSAPPSRVWQLTVTGGGRDPFARRVFIDAASGFVRLNFDPHPAAKRRLVCDRGNKRSDPDTCTAPYDITEGGSTARASLDAVNAYLYAGDTYDYFRTRFGRDSLDGKGLPLKSTVRYCPELKDDALAAPCPYPNAFWNGDERQMVYGAGYASADDVVGHELTHGVTQFEANLFSLYQSGAINESISDIFGELIDQYNASVRNRGRDSTGEGGTVDYRWLLFEDAPGGSVRNMRDPRVHKEPDRIRSGYYSAENEWSDTWDNGGVHANSGVGNKAAYFMAVGGSFNNRTIDPANALGTEKLGQLYYRVLTQHLTSGSDYADLADALRQSCAELVAGGPINVAGTAVTFTDTDCATVSTAVDATEMYLQPIVRQRRNRNGSLDVLDATNPQAPICNDGQAPSYLFYDSLEHPQVGNWATTHRIGSRDWFYPQNPNPFGLDLAYAKSGRLHMFADDPDSRSDFAITTTRAFVPTPTSYLRFDHAYVFDFNYDTGRGVDSGVVEYSVDGGATFIRLQPELGQQYGPVADKAIGNNSSIQGRAFVGDSHGYVSTRIFLGDLAGRSVRIRFRVATDSRFGDYGWFVDDVRLYDCAATNIAPSAPPPPPVIVSTQPAEDGIAVIWSAQTAPTGILGYTLFARSATHTATVSVPTGTAGYTIRGLSADAPYVVTVRARSAFGDSLSAPSNAVTPVDVRPPAPPGAPAVSAGLGAAVVSWRLDPQSFPRGLRVVVKAGLSAPESPTDGRAIDVAKGSSVHVAGLLANTPYSFGLFARDRLGRFRTAPAVARVEGSSLSLRRVGGSRARSISGVVRTSSGLPVRAARIDLFYRSVAGALRLADVTSSGQDGTFTFKAVPPGEVQGRFPGGAGVLGSVSAFLPPSAAK